MILKGYGKPSNWPTDRDGRAPQNDVLAIKSLYPNFTGVEKYLLVVAAMEKNKEKYDRLLENIQGTIRRVHQFNAALSEDATDKTTNVGMVEQFL